MKKILVVFSVVSFLLVVAVGMVCCDQARAEVVYIPPALQEDYTILAADPEQMEATLLFPEFGGMFVVFDDGDSHFFSENDLDNLSDLIRANKHILRKENRVALNITARMEGEEVIYFFYLSSGDAVAQYILHPPEE